MTKAIEEPASSSTTASAAAPTASGNRFLTGSAFLLISTTIVNLGNYLYNLIMGRWLGPAAFADVSLLVTLFLVVTLATGTLQTVAARFAAIYQARGNQESQSGLRRWGVRLAWLIGLGALAIMVLGAPFWQSFFHTASPWPFVILGIGVPIYFAQGVDRGVLQGQLRFIWLSMSYQAEMWVRLIAGVLLVWLGFGVNGAIAALTISFVATWLVAMQVRRTLPGNGIFTPEQRHDAITYAGPVAIALLSQIAINNSDVLLVKHYYPPEEAGLYAALALIGRIVFFATWSVVTVLLPSVAQRHEQGLPHRHLLWLSLGLVAAASVVVVAGAYFAGEWVVNLLFGPEYLAIAPLLWLYALATTLFALANVFIVYQLSLGQRVGSWLALAAGIIQIGAIILFHATLTQVVVVQVFVMSGLIVVLWLYEMVRGRHNS